MTRWGDKRCKKNSRAPNGATKGKKQLFLVYKIAAKRRNFFKGFFRREAAKNFWGQKKFPRFPRFFGKYCGSHGFLVPTVSKT